ncbi:MAG: DUF3224 domain-containing protein [Micrococcales bacterium]|nr:DUF3224 domain-containing protein [Micrococcales bacterium]
MAHTAGTFEVRVEPSGSELDGAVSRMGITKQWFGGIEGSGAGVMLSAGDPGAGAAGYVAIETVQGRLDGQEGSFAFAQMGRMSGRDQVLEYVVVPGSGTDELAGLTGEFFLHVDDDGTHHYRLEYDLPAGE